MTFYKDVLGPVFTTKNDFKLRKNVEESDVFQGKFQELLPQLSPS